MPVEAVLSDVPQLLLLVNSAYRGDEARKGWTHEADLIAGEARTDEKALEEIIRDPASVMLVIREEGAVVACVHLQKKTGGLYIGMLSVAPGQQSLGLGKQLLAAAEDHAYTLDMHRIYMTVISQRTALIQWYMRHGYRLTGVRIPFRVDPKFGQPKQPLEFVELEKYL